MGYQTYTKVHDRKFYVKVDFLENETGEITAGVYLLFITEPVNGVQQIGTGVPLTVNCFILGLIWGIIWVWFYISLWFT